MPELSVSKKSIGALLREMQNKKFIIPDYQRPYKWDQEKCEILWEDITEFYRLSDRETEYFLGTIVTYKGKEKKNELEVIDGQQRITSLLLLLRAFYKQIEDMLSTTPNDEEALGLKNQIAPCIWDVEPISGQVREMGKIHIESRVATENEKDIFHTLLASGVAELASGVAEPSQDNYSRNYRFFLDKSREYAGNYPFQWKELCVTILTRCIILPIECEDQTAALTIFSTLNDRGMPLSDSDIFKAKIYQSKTPAMQQGFITEWDELIEIAKKSKLKKGIDDIFRFYSHVIRAKESDRTKEIALRKFYLTENPQSNPPGQIRLLDPDLMKELEIIAEFWFSVNNRVYPPQIPVEAQKYLHCLSLYPNDFWKYATTVFYLKKRPEDDFADTFTTFLKKLTSFLFVKFIERPSLTAIKDNIYQVCIRIEKNEKDYITDEMIPTIIRDSLGQQLSATNSLGQQLIATSTSKLARALILLHSYQTEGQTEILPDSFDIEHIFPKKWQDTNYNGWGITTAQMYLEKFGNKIAMERPLNIRAGNGYFGQKRGRYRTSTIAEVKLLGHYQRNDGRDDWTQEDIELREQKFVENLIRFFEENLGFPRREVSAD